MRTRKDIRADIKNVEAEIIALRDKLIELNREDVLLSDDEQWFTEELEEWTKGEWETIEGRKREKER